MPGSAHPFKYRLAYVVDGACVLRCDNETGKGDHRHLGEVEMAYRFTTIEQLIDDFWQDVETAHDNRAYRRHQPRRFQEPRQGGLQGRETGLTIGFASLERMHKVLTPNRWTMLQAMMAGSQWASVNWRERWSAMSNKCVLDVTALINAGVIDRTEDDKVEFPYDQTYG